MDALEFLEKGGKTWKKPIYVVAGDEEFLKRRTIAALQTLILGEGDPAFALSTYPGDKAEFASVRGELDTLPFLCDYRLVIIEQADTFVTKYRASLEKYVDAPATHGVLILEVKSWVKTTILAKKVPEASTLHCKAPPVYKLAAWCTAWAQKQYGKKLPAPAANLLVELVGAQMGVLDSEIDKLAVFAGGRSTIEQADVDALVGRSRSANVFKIMDAIGDGKPDEALKILSELFEAGESTIGILGALGFQIRKIAAAARLHKLGAGMDDALTRADVAAWPQARDAARKQMKHLGWNRLDSLYDWLIETDLGMKGGNPLPEQVQMERLIVRLARPPVARK